MLRRKSFYPQEKILFQALELMFQALEYMFHDLELMFQDLVQKNVLREKTFSPKSGNKNS